MIRREVNNLPAVHLVNTYGYGYIDGRLRKTRKSVIMERSIDIFISKPVRQNPKDIEFILDNYQQVIVRNGEYITKYNISGLYFLKNQVAKRKLKLFVT